MGQVADVGALAVQHFLVMGDQGVEFLGQGRQLGRIGALDPLGQALAHVGHLAPQGEQRLQPHPHLDDHRRHQPGAQGHQGEGDAQGEVARIPLQRRPVLGDQEDDRRLAPGQARLQGGGPQRLAGRSGDVVENRLVQARGQGGRPAGRPQHGIGVPHRA